ncbi:bifunctional 2-polyprenyl-6-hydroxyphenol methylase/3-demethylubiquinol 3-O-methyltransferase UbiG [Nocardia sp. BMG111209]|uniref:class I SAM-dependent methyltransferase n=1 Tax=Nocardia sp. BMG111209 TaxID=1160137 RepID=UPI00036407EF|nr:class I SAM-dependent methyltransferase [Nocardia sp. BMG111209]
MPTPSTPPPIVPHEQRQVAESFGTDAARYDRARPPYPDAMIQRILAASPGPRVLDVGCGTGIAARQFAAAGCAVLGVEPDARMAEFARHTGIEVEVATFETWDAAGRRFDLVAAGTAWHWIDPVAGAAKAAEVLRPGGRLAPFWHVVELPAPVKHTFAEVYRRVVPDHQFDLRTDRSALEIYRAGFDRAAEGIAAAGAFDAAHQWRFDWERTYTRDEWLDQLPTQGSLTRLTPEQQQAVLTEVGAAIDDLGGSLTADYTTMVVTAVRR